MNLQFNITNDHIQLGGLTSYPVSDSVNHLTAVFEFDEAWDGFTKTAVFSDCDKCGKSLSVRLKDDGCIIPWETLTGHMLSVSVFGNKGDVRITSSVVKIPLDKSGYTEATTPEAPTPTVYEQLLAELERIDVSGLEAKDRELRMMIDTNSSLISTEQAAREKADEALSASINGLTARLSDVEQDMTFEQRFWNSFYREGRTDYSYAFVNSGASEINPPEPITANLISYALMNCVNLTDASSIIFNITSGNPKCVSVCMGCLMLTRPPTVNFVGENAHVCRSYVSMFANCVKLTEAAIWLGDGTQPASGERVDMANTFLNCTELQSITFTGAGSPKNLDLSACKKLTPESIESLLGALQDVTGETAGTYEFKISSETSALMSEELKTAFADKGWTVNTAEEAEA